MEKHCYVSPWLQVTLLNICVFLSFFSNCPSFLAAALARATSDEVLQSDLSAHYLPKHVDNADGIIRKYICDANVQLYVVWIFCLYRVPDCLADNS